MCNDDPDVLPVSGGTLPFGWAGRARARRLLLWHGLALGTAARVTHASGVSGLGSVKLGWPKESEARSVCEGAQSRLWAAGIRVLSRIKSGADGATLVRVPSHALRAPGHHLLAIGPHGSQL